MLFSIALLFAFASSVEATTMRREGTVDAAQAGMQREEEDRRIFKVADTNGNGLLETHEVEELLRHTSLPSGFDWNVFDSDKDGGLSKEEFVASGPAVAAEAAARQGPPQPSSLLEDEGAGPRLFAASDADGSGFLEENEIRTFMQTLGLPDGVDWHPLDRDADGRLSLAELEAAAKEDSPQAPASMIELTDADGAALETDDADAEAEDRKIFKQYDSNGNHFLEPGEIHDLLEKAGLKDQDFDWWPFDVDRDGLLSEKEFLSAGPAALEALEPAMQVFKHADSDGSSLLEAHEVDALQKGLGITPGAVNWVSFDHDGDDRLSMDEFRAAAPSVDAAIPREPASTPQAMDVASDGKPRRHVTSE